VLLRVFGLVTLQWEKFGMFLFFIPHPARALAWLGFAGMHAGFGACMSLGLFVFYPPAVLLAFLPSSIWRSRTRSRPIHIQFNGTAAQLRVLLLLREFCMRVPVEIDTQSEHDANTIITATVNNTTLHNREAAILLLRHSLLAPAGRLCESRAARHTARGLRWIASRFDVDSATERFLPLRTRTQRHSITADVAVVFVLSLSLASNVTALYQVDMPTWSNTPVYLLRIDQFWTMFAPDPVSFTRWFSVAGDVSFANGTNCTIDLWTGADVRSERPSNVMLLYRDQRWRKLLLNVLDEVNYVATPWFAFYMCRQWNNHNSEFIEAGGLVNSARIIAYQSDVLPGNSWSTPRQYEHYFHEC
jgi:hypothetical protein